MTAVQSTNLPGLVSRGKVRDLYDLGDRLMIVATDRISAFDVVMNDPVPGKGVLLTGMSRFWLETLPACKPHHMEYVVDATHCPRGYEAHREQLAGRAMVVRKARVLPVECVVRGYIVGSGWKDYQATGVVSGHKLPAGLKLADKLEQPLFTPSTKADHGHDEPISFEQSCEIADSFAKANGLTDSSKFAPIRSEDPAMASAGSSGRGGVGTAIMDHVRGRSLAIYQAAARHAAARGIIMADTKFEFGLMIDGPSAGQIALIDEALTPDSSRFWPADRWQPGKNPPSYDKQVLRDYLETLTWNKQPPAPPLPANVIEATRKGYETAARLLTS